MIGGHTENSRYSATSEKDVKRSLLTEVMDSINAGAISDKGVHGLANSLHISERHLRRIVQKRTGSSPLHLNQTKRLDAARLLITRTKLPITDIAFVVEFSSLRQFNDVFKHAFKTSPSQMRKTASLVRTKKAAHSIVVSLRSSYAAVMKIPLKPSTNK